MKKPKVLLPGAIEGECEALELLYQAKFREIERSVRFDYIRENE